MAASPSTSMGPLGGLHVEIPPRLKSFLTHPFNPQSLQLDVEASTTNSGGFGEMRFDLKAMEAFAGRDVTERFRACLVSGKPTSPEDATALEGALFSWCSAHNCMNYAHWFFPLRTGGGAMGATSGMKHDSFIDADWDSASSEAPGQDLFHKPFKATMPPGRLFHGEIDGSSFPSGGLRSTSKAAAFTSWDRASPPFVYSGTCYIPCALVSPNGSSLDDKTPLLRSNDAVQREGLRLLKNIDIGSNKHHYEDVKQVATYLGWEQEFFVVSKEAFLARPDLRACGRTLFGALPTKGMQTDLNYFAAMPPSVKACLNEVHEELLKIGCPLNVHHNEVAPAQYEISPFFTISNLSADQNQIAMQICCDVAAKHDLVFLFHEKPFAGINGSCKHNNWSVATDNGLNFFCPDGGGSSGGASAHAAAAAASASKAAIASGHSEASAERAGQAALDASTKASAELFAAATACLTFAMNQHNTAVRASVAHPGNDHRLGCGQEAPPTVLSIDPGPLFEAKMHAIVAGGPLEGGEAAAAAAAVGMEEEVVEEEGQREGFGRGMLDVGCGNLNPIPKAARDRNRTSPFPFYGNRWEFRSVGSSQNCSFPMAMLNTAFADGMRALNDLLEGKGEGGVRLNLRDACAKLYQDNQRVVFTGNAYSQEWRDEAKRRGLPNLPNSVAAAAAFASPENKALFERMKVLSGAEVEARAACLLQSFSNTVACEASTAVRMVRQGVEAAMAVDLNLYGAHPNAHARRAKVYNEVSECTDKLEYMLLEVPTIMPRPAPAPATSAAAAATPLPSEEETGAIVLPEDEAWAETKRLHNKSVAEFYASKVAPCLFKLRLACDAAEGLVKADLWPYPTYTDICLGHLTEAPMGKKKSRV